MDVKCSYIIGCAQIKSVWEQTAEKNTGAQEREGSRRQEKIA
jgi:hypothetical protein